MLKKFGWNQILRTSQKYNYIQLRYNTKKCDQMCDYIFIDKMMIKLKWDVEI